MTMNARRAIVLALVLVPGVALSFNANVPPAGLP